MATGPSHAGSRWSTLPFLPIPPLLHTSSLRSPLFPPSPGGGGRLGDGGKWEGETGWGRRGPPPGQLSPALGWLEGQQGKVALGFPPSWRRVHHRQVLPAPSPESPHPRAAQRLPEISGQGSQTCHCALSPPTLPTLVRIGVFKGRPSKVRPLSTGQGQTVPQRALGRSYHRARGLFFGHAGREVSTRG